MALLSYNKFFAFDETAGAPPPAVGGGAPVNNAPPPPAEETPPPPGPTPPPESQAAVGAGEITPPPPGPNPAPNPADFLTNFGEALSGGGENKPPGDAPAGDAGQGAANANGLMGDNPLQMFMSAIQAFFDGSLMSMLQPGGLREVELTAADKDAAQKAADDAYNRLDKSKDNVLLSFQGTGQHDLDPNVAAGAGPGVATVNVDYPADIKMDRGVAFGEEAGRILIQRLKDEGKNVSLYGYSQGAMVAGQLAGDKSIYDMIDHALLVGHPVSDPFQFDDGASSKVSEVNAQGDGYASTPDNKGLSIFSILSGLGAHGNYDMRALVAEHIANSFGSGSAEANFNS